MQTLELINFGSKVLKEKLIPSYKLDSELLLASVLGKKREQMLVSINENVSKIIRANKHLHGDHSMRSHFYY